MDNGSLYYEQQACALLGKVADIGEEADEDGYTTGRVMRIIGVVLGAVAVSNLAVAAAIKEAQDG